MYLFVLAALGLSVFLSTIFPRYLLWFGFLNLLFFVVYVVYTINLQRMHLRTFQDAELSTTQPSVISPSASQNIGASHHDDSDDLDGDEEEKNILLPIKIVLLIIVTFAAGELMIVSAEHRIVSLALKETFFGFVIMAFVTNVEEFWLIVKAIQRQQVALGVSAEIGKILWNLSFIYGLSSLFLKEFVYQTVMMQGSFVMWLALMLLVASLLMRRMSRLQSFSFLLFYLLCCRSRHHVGDAWLSSIGIASSVMLLSFRALRG